MKILYDHQIFSTQIYGGISRYFIELMKKYENDDEIKYELPLMFSNNHYLEQLSNFFYWSFFAGYDFKRRDRIINYLNGIVSKKNIFKKDYDIFHPTYYDPYFLDYIGDKPFVLTIHDMIHEIYPDMFSLTDEVSKRKKLLAQKATKIIAVSKNTKKDIIKYLNINESKIEVIYHANSLKLNNDIRFKDITLPEKYILFIGSRGRYKNFNLFIEAISPLLVEDTELKVVCAGGGNFSNIEIDKFNSLNIKDKLFYYSGSDSLLAYLYNKAIVFVFPSLYEGFGIPILESFTCRCPVICSKTSSLPEVAGNAAVYFEPTDKVSMLNSIQKVIYNNNLRNQLIEKGFEKIKNFTWEKTAEKTKSFYKGILRAKC